ncbi:MAG: DUF3726 domain-containing protein [Proteobacteria bacterium]|nr:DUF3726 domain-containing protein [Pseudomonadota bacterium]
MERTLSRTESRALAVKAAKGAGLDWGLAEEAGYAVEWLAARGIDGLSPLAAWLDARAAGSGARCPLALGARLADLPPAAGLSLGPVAWPVLLLPFLDRSGLGLAGKDGAAPAPDCPQADLVAVGRASGSAAVGPARRAPTPCAALDRLEALALMTTVPPSARSRADAGAGMLDND